MRKAIALGLLAGVFALGAPVSWLWSLPTVPESSVSAAR